ncbi:hypothetical protein [Evansella clarkii]|uniref:hypothetical protein n=1 Tax=Evansella clarkii TaxID=79879 RepID=UPI0009969814|nr:hypothetical protein [Evansella clarkii]
MRQLPVDLNSTERYTDNIGDKMPLNEFLECCDGGMFIDYDGHASEVILDGRIISDKPFSPSDLEEGVREQLLDIQKTHGNLTIVWYNK